MLLGMLVWIILAVVIGVAVVVVLARRGAKSASTRVEGRLAELDIDRQAKGTFYGLASAGEGQVRRLGTLVLTPDALVFLQFVPEGEVSIPRADITGAESSPTYLGKTSDRALLVVTFAADGVEGGDQAAWELPDVAGWRAALRSS
jgi:hypothetical protein